MKVFDNSSVKDLIDGAMDKVKCLMDSSTIVGDPILTPDGVTIIPISKISIGYVVGGGEYSDKSHRRVSNHFPMAGGSGGGISVSPIGFLVESVDGLKFIDVMNHSAYDTILNLFNAFAEKMKKPQVDKEDIDEKFDN